MRPNFKNKIKQEKTHFFGFLNYLSNQANKLLLVGEFNEHYVHFLAKDEADNTNIAKYINCIQEGFQLKNIFYMDVREKIGESETYAVHLEEQYIETTSVKEYLIAKEKYVHPFNENNIVTLDFKPFYNKSPLVRDEKHIGRGVEYLNRYLSSQMFTDTKKWKKLLFDFLRMHKYEMDQLIMNDRITDPEQLAENIDAAFEFLNTKDEEEAYENIKHDLQDLGFEKGLGKNAGEISKSLSLLDNLLNSPDHLSLAEFISRIPMIFKIAIVSSHGYFAQEGVLGMPDTGGQVVYILDQVRALEKALIESLETAGLDIMPKIIILTRLIPNAENTNCNERLEKVHGTKNSWILRVPFREHNPKVTDNWISRFEIYPYLEEFAEDSSIQLSAEFGGRPDFIIGNYSDGNLVAYLLSKKFGVTQSCIAHALEKNKYLFGALYWDKMEDQYNFSLQFTTDLIAMNSADFLITSTFQEIAGTEHSIGQYESYEHFTLPNLYRVENGVNPRHTKFNIVSPGVNENIFFPYTKEKDRVGEIRKHLDTLFFGNSDDPDVIGILEDPSKTPLFTMARLDKNKNLSALVRWFGKSETMRKHANLIIVAGKIDESQSNDKEEISEIRKMHELIAEYDLGKQIRWIGKLFRKDESGEAYRVIADHKGLFIQPGLFEGFGLTVLEAMISGLPTFATKYGGPLEIINNGKNGFHLDTANDNHCIDTISDFLIKMQNDPGIWNSFSEKSIKRVNEAYNWRLYTQKLLSLSKIYGFWKYVTNLETKDMKAYLSIIYHLLYKPRAEALLDKHNKM